MRVETKNIIVAACAADTSVAPKDVKRAIEILAGGAQEDRDACRPLKFKDAADLLGVSTKTVERWANKGLIRRIKLPGARNGHRLVRQDVLRLRDGKTVEPVQA